MPVLAPDLQIAFFHRLREVQGLYLDDALQRTVSSLDVVELDAQLARAVSRTSLTRVASFGIRGEVMFAVPCVLQACPFLLAYYRLLYGLSQKEFYKSGRFSRFKRMEELGEIPERVHEQLPDLCKALIGTGELLVAAMDQLSLSMVRDLQMLTLGAQFRGSQNTKLGQDATAEFYDMLGGVVGPYVQAKSQRTMTLRNESGRVVLIEFFSDPDVRITEQLASSVRPLVSIEIKGGGDFSNIHNRLGEAEKSHLKAKKRGFFEFWTVVRVAVDKAAAKQDSPTTTHFFNLDLLKDPASEDSRLFSETLGSLLGIRT